MKEAYIVGAVRTPVGRRGGALASIHPADLGAAVLNALVARTGVDPAAIDDVVFGCVDQVGAQSFNVARTSVLAAGWPESVPATTVDRQCGSSLQALHFAAQATMSGTQDLVVAGGIEVMSLVPLSSSTTLGAEHGLGDALGARGFRARYPGEISQFRGACLLTRRHGLTRAELEAFALASHARAIAAWDGGRFDVEVVPVAGLTRDEGPRRDTDAAKLAALPPLAGYPELTAAMASQISDGAAAVLVASAQAVARHSLVPLARLAGLAVARSDPVEMLSGPVPATVQLLARAGLSVDEVDLFEVNEAFAPVVLAWSRATGAPFARTNVNGGAIRSARPAPSSPPRSSTSCSDGPPGTGSSRSARAGAWRTRRCSSALTPGRFDANMAYYDQYVRIAH